MEELTTDKEILRRALCGYHLILDISDDYAWVFNQLDAFIAQSQGNETIGCVSLFPYDDDPGNYELWDKVGQGVGNLKSLDMITIHLHNNLNELDWEILARILPHISIESKIELRIMGKAIAGTEEMRAFARAIQGQPAITQFQTRTASFSFESVATLCSALTTLPNLESAILRHRKLHRGEGVPTLRFPESMTEFLRVPSLRIVEFREFCFMSSLCLATLLIYFNAPFRRAGVSKSRARSKRMQH
jgi:hypothetical protein